MIEFYMWLFFATCWFCFGMYWAFKALYFIAFQDKIIEEIMKSLGDKE